MDLLWSSSSFMVNLSKVNAFLDIYWSGSIDSVYKYFYNFQSKKI